ncbi:MAG: multifunctional acyl-CoA thioesterase and protease and lysophospholipase [Verrucomicrobiales bacterium]|nr:multifunctional acyl-CoA thioesterase and protease and lysophospholipase [Verrucomicrobiales bacterium]
MKRWLSFTQILCLTAVVFTLPAAEPVADKKPEPPAVAEWPGIENFPGKGGIANADWFHAAWASRRTHFWEQRNNDKHAIIFLGDSITQGWGSLERDFPNYKVANRGIGGDTTRGIWYRLNEDVLDTEPEAVVLLIGTNDIGLDTTPEQTAENLKTVLALLKKHNPKMPVIICKTMPSSGKMKRPADKLQKFNALVDDLIKGDKQFIRCDTWSIFADEKGDAKLEEFPDLLHPNAAGYAKWKAALDPIFAKLNVAVKKP